MKYTLVKTGVIYSKQIGNIMQSHRDQEVKNKKFDSQIGSCFQKFLLNSFTVRKLFTS